MDKESVIYTQIYMHMHIYIHRHIQWNIITHPLKKEIPPSATTWRDLEGIMLSEMSDKYTVLLLICGI